MLRQIYRLSRARIRGDLLRGEILANRGGGYPASPINGGLLFFSRPVPHNAPMTLTGKLCHPALENYLRRGRLAVVVVLATLNVGCQGGANVNYAANHPPADATEKAGYEIVNVFPHDASAYTQAYFRQWGYLRK